MPRTVVPRTVRRGATSVILLAVVAMLTVVPSSVAQAALPETASPALELDHTIRTKPFNGSSVSMKDHEGSAYVARDGSLWLADDSARMVYEVNATTGALKRTIDRNAFAAVSRFGGGPVAGTDRARDIEGMAYDVTQDVLYVFSGNCCTSSVLPTVFRLTRQSGILRLDSYQPLASSSDFSAAAWNPGDGKLYVGVSRDLRSYDYLTNTAGAIFRVPDVSGILGMTFSADGKDLFIARKATTLSRVDWGTKTLVKGWTFDLSPFGMLDSRAVELVGDQIWVSDGYDSRPAGDPLSHAVFVFNVRGSSSSPKAPTASFTASPTSGAAPLTVRFTDTSAGNPTSWRWEFGDGLVSTEQHPSHLYTVPGTYSVTLTASNSVGSSTATAQVVVDAPATPGEEPQGENLVGNSGFETSTAGWDTAGYSTVKLERVSGGHASSWAAKITNSASTSVTNTLNDAPNWVQTSRAGTYTGTMWVRSDTSGSKLYLRIREFKGSTKVAEKLVGIPLSTTWQQVSASLAPVAPGESTIDFSAAVYSAPAGSSFFADDATLTLS